MNGVIFVSRLGALRAARRSDDKNGGAVDDEKADVPFAVEQMKHRGDNKDDEKDDGAGTGCGGQKE